MNCPVVSLPSLIIPTMPTMPAPDERPSSRQRLAGDAVPAGPVQMPGAPGVLRRDGSGHGLGMQTPVRSAMCGQDWGEGRLEVIVLMGPDQSDIASVIHANHPPATPRATLGFGEGADIARLS